MNRLTGDEIGDQKGNWDVLTIANGRKTMGLN